jgi:hypothetical protein
MPVPFRAITIFIKTARVILSEISRICHYSCRHISGTIRQSLLKPFAGTDILKVFSLLTGSCEK